ncbi:MAG: hypothetical protein PQJ50_08330, partial [Spirochaetales bacterium]|nr:hypothetical protein [Spirochaetales bacterium]
KAGTPVHIVEGSAVTNTLEVRGGTAETVMTLGDVIVEPKEWLTPHLAENNRAEIIDYGHKKGAAVLSLNGRFNAVEGSSVRQALAEGKSYRKKSSDDEKGFELTPGRELSPEEVYYLNSDYRVLPSILAALAVTAAIAFPQPALKAAAAAAAVLISLVFILPGPPRFARKKKMKKAVNISGILEKDGEDYSIARHTLTFPAGWEKKVIPGQRITAEGYPVDEGGTLVRIIGLSGLYSLKRDLAKAPVKKGDRFLPLWISLAAALFFSLIPLGDMPYKLQQITRYLTTKNMPSDFDEVVTDTPFKIGQTLNFHGVPWIPVPDDSSSVYLLGSGDAELPDFSPALELVDLIDRVQMTDEFFFLSAMAYSDRMGIYEFYTSFYPFSLDRELPYMEEYEDEFQDSSAFALVREYVQVIEDLPEDFNVDDSFEFPAGGALKEYFGNSSPTVENLIRRASRVRSKFLEEQLAAVNDIIDSAFTGYLEERGALSYENWDKYETTTSYKVRMDVSDISKFNVSSYGFSGSNVQMAEEPGVAASLETAMEVLSKTSPRDFSGVIEVQGTDLRGITKLHCKDSDYPNLPFYLADSAIFILALLGMSLGLGIWLRMKNKNN